MVNFQPRGTDTVPAMLTPGEFVVNRSATQKHLPLLTAINDGVKPYQTGGIVYAQTGGRLSLRKELPSVKPRPQNITTQTIEVEIPEPAKPRYNDSIPTNPRRRFGFGDNSGSFGDVLDDGSSGKPKSGSSGTEKTRKFGQYSPSFEIETEELEKSNNGKSGIIPPTESILKLKYKTTGGIVYAQDGGQILVSAESERQRALDKAAEGNAELNKLMRDETIPYNERLKLLKQRLPAVEASRRSAQALKEPPIDLVTSITQNWNAGVGALSDLNNLSTALDVAGLIPVVGNFADLANVGVNLLRGDLTGAGLSALAAVPGLGLLAGSSKIGIKGAAAMQKLRTIDAAVNTGLLVKGASEAAYDQFTSSVGGTALASSFLIASTGSGNQLQNYIFEGTDKKDAIDTLREYRKQNPSIDFNRDSSGKIVARIVGKDKLPIMSADTKAKYFFQSNATLDAIKAADAAKAADDATKAAKGTGKGKLAKWFIGSAIVGSLGVAGVLAWMLGKDKLDDIKNKNQILPFEGPLDRGQRLPPGPVLPNVDIDQINRDLEEADKKSKRERLEAFGPDERYLRKLMTLPDKDGNRIPDMIDFVYSQIEDDRKTGLIRALARNTRDIREDSGIDLLVGNINPQLTVGKLAELYESYNFLGDKDGWKKAKKALIDSPDSDNYYVRGGVVYANNGMLIPYEPRGTDTVPAMLTPGEFVVNRAATQQNLPLLKAINNGSQAYAKGGVVYAAEGGEFPKNRVRQLDKDAEDRIQGGLAADEARRQKIEDAIEQRNRERDAVAYKPRSDLRNSKPLDQDLYDFDNANSWRIYTDDAFVNRGLHPGSYWGAALTPEDLVASAPSYEQRRLKTLIRAGKLAHEQGAITKDKEDQNARQQILDQIYQNRDAATSKLERISTGKDIGAVDETDPQKLYQRYEQTALDRFLQWYFYKSKANAGESQRDFLKRTRSAWDSDFDFDNPYSFNNVVTRSKGESEERFVEELIKQGLNAVEAFEKYPALPKKFLSTLEFATINNLSDSQRESLFSIEDQIDPGMEALNIAIQQMIDDKNKQFAEAQKAQAKAVANKAAQSRPQSKASAAVDPGMKMFSQIAERRWEDSTGQHSTIGTLQELIEDKVRISKLNGKTTLMSVSQLSTADQNYIRELQEVRNWTDDTGKYKTQARVIGVGKQGIMIQKLDGSTKNVPMNRLSKQDQDYLRQQYADVLASKPSKPKTQTKDVGVSSEDIPSQDSEPPVKSSGLPTSSDGWVGDYYGAKGRPKDNEERYPMRREYQAIIRQLQQAKRRIFRKEGNEIIPQNLTLPWNEAENKQWADVFNKIYEFDQKYKTIPDGLGAGLRDEALGKALKLYEAHRAAYSAPERMRKQAEAEIASWSEKQKEYQYKIDRSRTLDPMEEGFVVGLAKTFKPFGEVNLDPRSDELTDGRTNQLYLKRIQKEVFDASKFLSSYYGLEDVYEGIASYKEKGLQDWLNSNQARKPSYRQYGGPIYASNGTLVNYQPRGTDTVPAMLTPGEFVVNKQATQKNLPLLQAINSNNYSRGGVVYMAAAGLVPMTPGELEDAANEPRNRRGQPPLNRQQQRQQQQQARDQKQQAEIKRKRFLSLSPMMRMLIQEINNQPALYDDFDNSAIDEQLDSAKLVQKIDEKIKDVGDPSPAGTSKKQKIFMDRGISDFNRFNQLMRWHTNSKNALEYKGTKETDFLDPQTGLPRVVGDFIDKYPSQKQLGFRAILSTQKNNSIKEASAIRNGWITLAQRHNNLFNGMSPEQIINGIITTATKPKAFNNGGVVYANNGMLIPYQPKGTDTVPAMLTPGEFVVNRESTRQNLGLLRAINSNSYANGGVVKYLSEGTAGGLSFTKILSSFTSGIQRAAAAIDTLLTTLQNTSGGVNNDSSSVSVGGLDGLGQFTAKFDQFITQLSQLNLPPEININGNHKVEVVINGAQALQSLLDGPLSGLIRREVQSAFSRLNAESEGSIPDPTKQ
jgi:hypothetical protein